MFRGAALQATMADVRMQGIHSLRFVLEGDSVEVFQREAQARAIVGAPGISDCADDGHCRSSSLATPS
jgi:hypothetical protein